MKATPNKGRRIGNCSSKPVRAKPEESKSKLNSPHPTMSPITRRTIKRVLCIVKTLTLFLVVVNLRLNGEACWSRSLQSL